MRVPLLCFDNFYKDPDKIRDYALGLWYGKPFTGFYPGLRSDPLHEINPEYFNIMCDKFMSLLTQAHWKGTILTQFQRIPNDSVTSGLVHNDGGDAVCAGVVYLNPDPTPGSGTSFFKAPTNVVDFEGDDYPTSEESMVQYNSQFKKTIEVDNVYNRVILYDAQEWHAHTNSYMEREDRLTQVFFINSLSLQNDTLTFERCNSYDL
tara:strand:+ start:717 stop:1334 length:618 start_codon:yes stop_codon:yes gene_type:complete